MAFGGKVSSQTFGTSAVSPPKLNLLRIEEDLFTAHLRVDRVYIEHLDWPDCVKKYDREGTLFHLDPPYWGTASYGMDFGLEQYKLMAELARIVQGRMIISVNDIPEMRAACEGLSMRSLGIRYTMGGRKGSQAKGLLIWNW